MSRLTRLGLLLVLAASACDHVERSNLDPAREQWSTAGVDIRERAVALRTRQQALAGRINAVKVPEGTEDPRLTEAITQLQAQVPSLDSAIGAVERALSQATQEAEVALARPDKIAAKRTVEKGLADFDAAADAADGALDAITPQVVTAEGLMQALLDTVAAEVRRLTALASTGGSADFSDIDFKVGSTEFDFTRPASKATLDRLVGFAGACDALRFSLTGHTSREGSPSANKALSLARAEAVKKYLLDAGVAGDKIVATDGLGAARPALEEPAPGTPEAAAIAPADLEARRRKNRRVTVAVITPCQVATPPTQPPPGSETGAAPAAGTPPRAADAVPPGAPRGAPVRVERVDPARPADPARPVAPSGAR